MKTKKVQPYFLSPTIGTISEDKIVGREKEIISLLRLLQGQSVTVEEIRRMGKTLLVQKLAYRCNNDLLSEEFKKDNFKAKYLTFQGKENFAQLIEHLIRELQDFKNWYNIDLSNTYNAIAKILNIPKFSILGVDISIDLPVYEQHSKEIFNNLLNDISNSLKKNKTKLILIFDELPIMLWDWYKKGKYNEAIELLDILRERRQSLEKSGLRFIFCGSIGMNVILDTFKTKYGYTGEATNEMEQFSLGAFSYEEVEFLCECYTLAGFNVKNNKRKWKLINKLTNGIPFYISKIFNIIQMDFDKKITEGNIKSAYDEILNNTKNHNSFKQLVDRIDTYYSQERSMIMKTILNFLSKQEDFISEENIIAGIDYDEKSLKNNLYTLLADHYLLRKIVDDKRYYKFKYEIFRKWWRINIA